MKILPILFLLGFFSNATCQGLTWFVSDDSPISVYKNEDVFFVNDSVGYLTNNLGTNCKLFKTTNGGINWYSIYSSPNYFRSLTFLNENTGWLGLLDKDLLLYTSDGGVDWSIVENFIGEKPEGICSLFKLNDSYIFGCGKYTGPAHFIKTTDSGLHWYSYNLSTYAQCLIDCFFINKDSGFVVGGVGNDNYKLCSTIILFTSDGGESWREVYKNLSKENIAWKIFNTDSHFFQVSIQSFKGVDTVTYLTSYDGGFSWDEHSFKCNSPIFESLGISFINESTGFVSGIRRSNLTIESGEVYCTTDYGKTWTPNYLLENVNRFRKINPHTIVATGKVFYKLTF